MIDVSALIDRARLGAGGVTDYRLAKLIGVTPQTISGYRAGVRSPDGRAIVKLCELSGDDPHQVAAEIQATRAASQEEAELWRRVASRLAGSVAAVVVVFVVAAGFSPSPAMAESGHHGLYIMSTLLVLRLAWGVVKRVRARTLPASWSPPSS